MANEMHVEFEVNGTEIKALREQVANLREAAREITKAVEPVQNGAWKGFGSQQFQAELDTLVMQPLQNWAEVLDAYITMVEQASQGVGMEDYAIEGRGLTSFADLCESII
jgi:uncharacterized protein YukE